jgi:hypothetical protein
MTQTQVIGYLVERSESPRKWRSSRSMNLTRSAVGLRPWGFFRRLGAAFVTGRGIEVVLAVAHNGFCRLLIEAGRNVEGLAVALPRVCLKTPGGACLRTGALVDRHRAAKEDSAALRRASLAAGVCRAPNRRSALPGTSAR